MSAFVWTGATSKTTTVLTNWTQDGGAASRLPEAGDTVLIDAVNFTGTNYPDGGTGYNTIAGTVTITNSSETAQKCAQRLTLTGSCSVNDAYKFAFPSETAVAIINACRFQGPLSITAAYLTGGYFSNTLTTTGTVVLGTVAQTAPTIPAEANVRSDAGAYGYNDSLAGSLDMSLYTLISGVVSTAYVIAGHDNYTGGSAGQYVDPANSDVWHDVAVGVSPRAGTKQASSIANLTASNLASGVTVGDVGPGEFTNTADYTLITSVVDAAYVLVNHDNYTGGDAGTLEAKVVVIDPAGNGDYETIEGALIGEAATTADLTFVCRRGNLNLGTGGDPDIADLICNSLTIRPAIGAMHSFDIDQPLANCAYITKRLRYEPVAGCVKDITITGIRTTTGYKLFDGYGGIDGDTYTIRLGQCLVNVIDNGGEDCVYFETFAGTWNVDCIDLALFLSMSNIMYAGGGYIAVYANDTVVMNFQIFNCLGNATITTAGAIVDPLGLNTAGSAVITADVHNTAIFSDADCFLTNGSNITLTGSHNLSKDTTAATKFGNDPNAKTSITAASVLRSPLTSADRLEGNEITIGTGTTISGVPLELIVPQSPHDIGVTPQLNAITDRTNVVDGVDRGDGIGGTYPTTASTLALVVFPELDEVDGGVPFGPVTGLEYEGTGMNLTTLQGELDTRAYATEAKQDTAKTVLDTIAIDVAGLDGEAMRGTDNANTVAPDNQGIADAKTAAEAVQALVEDSGDGDLAAVKTTVDTIAIDVAGLDGEAMRGTNGAYTGTPPTAAQNAEGLLDLAGGVETGVSVRQTLQRIGAVIAGEVSGAGTGTEVFMGLDGTTERVSVTVDSAGNRTAIEHDPS